jgi:hypothetical protein
MNAKYYRYLTEDQQHRWENNTLTFDQFKRAVAHYLFQKATEYDQATYTTNKANFANPDIMQYQSLDIEVLRKVVHPISGN